MSKSHFLEHDFIALLSGINPQTPPLWGKMNLQQMTEHMSDSMRIANGKDPKDCVTLPDHLPKMRHFLLSDKPFKENTVNIQLPETPLPPRFDNMDDAIGELKVEIADFFDLFKQDRHKIVTNPFFGDLDYEEWVQLLYKHALHHLRQFGVQVDATKNSVI